MFLTAAISLTALLILIFPLRIACKLLFPGKRTSGEIIDAYYGQEWFDPAILELGWENFSVKSYDGTLICGQILSGTSDNCIIFTHGITGTRMSALRMFEPFIISGWNVVIFDQRGHGESGRGLPAYGYKEKYDLERVVEYIREKFPGSRISLYGISMGAATVLQYLPISENIYRCAADSSFSSLKEQLFFRFRAAGLPYIIQKQLMFATGILIRLFGGFRLSECSPAASSASAEVPLLLVHASEDLEVPVEMCSVISGSRTAKSCTEIFISFKGGHTEACTASRKQWIERMNSFFGN